MADTLTPAQRSALMSRIRGRDTVPEKTVRALLHRAGYRFRLHGHLPGRPDIVLPRLRAVVFVHGCFWHRHGGCGGATNPRTRPEFWQEKFRRNVERDRVQSAALRRDGWAVWTVWECQLKKPEQVGARLVRLAEAREARLGIRHEADRPTSRRAATPAKRR